MKIISSKEVFKNKLFSVTDEIAVDPDGFEIHRNIVRHPGSAVMLAVDDARRILLVKQFRLPAERELGNCPRAVSIQGKSRLKQPAANSARKPAIRRIRGKSSLASGPVPGMSGRR